MKQKLVQPIIFLGIGFTVGILTRLTDLMTNDLWALQSIATLFGFWIVSVVIVILFSQSAKAASLYVFCYLFGMTFSFYLSKYLLGLVFPQFDGPFQWNLFFLYSILSIGCSVISYGLWHWNKNGKLSSVLRGLPIGFLLAEMIGLSVYFGLHHTYLFQLLFDMAFVLILGIAFFQKSATKFLYFLTVFIIAGLGYALFYAPFLLIT